MPETDFSILYKSQSYFMAVPKVSIIITDYIRHSYLDESIKSIVEQDIQFSEIELIILTDSKNCSYKQIPNELSSIVFYTGLITMGKSYEFALRVCRGEIICPLDNDDVFRRDKISKVLWYFEQHKNLTLLKNEILPFGAKANFLTRISFLLRMNVRLVCTNKIYFINDSVSNKILGKSLFHNVSSMSFRKSIFESEKELANLSEVVSIPDPFLFFHALSKSGEVAFLDDTLTYYRIDENLSGADFTAIYCNKNKLRYQVDLMNNYFILVFKNEKKKIFNVLYKIFNLLVTLELFIKANELNSVNKKDLTFLLKFSLTSEAPNYFLIVLTYLVYTVKSHLYVRR